MQQANDRLNRKAQQSEANRALNQQIDREVRTNRLVGARGRTQTSTPIAVSAKPRSRGGQHPSADITKVAADSRMATLGGTSRFAVLEQGTEVSELLADVEALKQQIRDLPGPSGAKGKAPLKAHSTGPTRNKGRLGGKLGNSQSGPSVGNPRANPIRSDFSAAGPSEQAPRRLPRPSDTGQSLAPLPSSPRSNRPAPNTHVGLSIMEVDPGPSGASHAGDLHQEPSDGVAEQFSTHATVAAGAPMEVLHPSS